MPIQIAETLFLSRTHRGHVRVLLGDLTSLSAGRPPSPSRTWRNSAAVGFTVRSFRGNGWERKKPVLLEQWV